jgi:predicted nucleotidyltransferase component of viral defense system
MPFNDTYRRQVGLLIQALPIIAREKDFALKGGTAINLFIRDLPRLSVDIDLTYLPVASRADSLGAIETALRRIGASLEKEIRDAKVTYAKRPADEILTRLVLKTYDAQIKIEVTPVLRGCVFAPEIRAVSPLVEEQFGFAEATLVSFADLYAGKIMAALDRQHPRDLFDVRDLLAKEGIDDALRRAFIIYLISHHRPMHEVLRAPQKDITEKYESEFAGMTADPVPLADLRAARAQLIDAMVGAMPAPHRAFLLGFEAGTPDWALLGLPEAANLPAVRWRQQNLDGLAPERRAELLVRLASALA